METEQKDIPEKQKHPGKKDMKDAGEQYLFALIKCADWVGKPYKQLAEKNRMNTEFLKQLYLCACDGIPIEEARAAQEKNPPEGALKFLRQKYLEESVVNSYQNELTDIKGTTAALEKEVKQMNGLLLHISDHVPDFDAMFPEDVPDEILDEEMADARELLPEKKPEAVPTGQGTGHPLQQASQEMDVPKSGTKNGKKKWFPWKRKREAADFIERSLDAGYSKEQLEYLLDCMEEGMAVEEIEKFSSPKLPVDIMRRLRMMEERKEIE